MEWITGSASLYRLDGSWPFMPCKQISLKIPGEHSNKIAPIQSPQIREQTAQPFRSRPFAPQSGAPLFSCEKVDRSAYTQSDPSGLGPVGNAAGENLLLRHSYCEKNEGSLGLDNEVNAVLHLVLRIDEPHRRRVKLNVEARISYEHYLKTLVRRAQN
jgi:hypothetical protein